MVIVKNSFNEICRQINDKDEALLKDIDAHVSNSIMFGAFVHVKSFLPAIKVIIQIEKEKWHNENEITSHLIIPDILSRKIIWKSLETNQELYREPNPISNFSLKWEVIIINDRQKNKILGFIHFLMYKTWVPVTKLFIAEVANSLDLADIFKKISETY